jgi:hypothetical protein
VSKSVVSGMASSSLSRWRHPEPVSLIRPILII